MEPRPLALAALDRERGDAMLPPWPHRPGDVSVTKLLPTAAAFAFLTFASVSAQPCLAVEPPPPPSLPLEPGLRKLERSDLGTTLALHLQNNPFPCPGFPWMDPTTLLFVPKTYRPGAKLELLVHFHGHDGQAERKMREHQLREQVLASGRNVLLAVVQGPLNAGDSSGGKLEAPQGFAKYRQELLEILRSAKVRKALGSQAPSAKATWHRIALSAHSGGYRAVAYILDQGGAEIAEVYLWDALYGEVPRFRRWLAGAPERVLRSWYTGGAPQKLNQILVQRLAEDRSPVRQEDPEGGLTAQEFCAARRLFIRTAVKHGEVPWRHNTLRDALICSDFSRIPGLPKVVLGPAHGSRPLGVRPPASL